MGRNDWEEGRSVVERALERKKPEGGGQSPEADTRSGSGKAASQPASHLAGKDRQMVWLVRMTLTPWAWLARVGH